MSRAWICDGREAASRSVRKLKRSSSAGRAQLAAVAAERGSRSTIELVFAGRDLRPRIKRPGRWSVDFSGSRRGAVVLAQQTTQAFTGDRLALRLDCGRVSDDQPVAEALVVALS